MSTAIERLQAGHYNSGGVSGGNPGGLGNGGHVQNFPSALQDVGDVAQGVGGQAAQAVGAAGSADASAAAAAADRQLAQQAAAAAAAFDPAAFARKAGDRFSGQVAVGQAGGHSLVFEPSTGLGPYIEFRSNGVRHAYIGNASAETIELSAEGGRTWSFGGGVMVGGNPVYTAANDGSGSGLDADLCRGLAPTGTAEPGTIATRGSDGSIVATGISLFGDKPEKGIFWGTNGAFLRDEGERLNLNAPLYLQSSLSASVVTERSDRSLKEDIVDLEPPLGRLRPVRYRLKATAEERIGFIAQEVAEVQPLAVAQPEDGMMEVRLTALIAHLAQQLNTALDRIDALEQAK